MGYLTMSTKERQLKVLLEMVNRQKLSLKMVSEQIGLSYRQLKRIYKRYKNKGDEGLVHRSRGRVSNRRHPDQALIIERYQSQYEDFGPTLAAEKLLTEGFIVDHETLRRWLIMHGLWCKKRRRLPYKQRRERKAQFGELVQMDGSIHDWFENGKLNCLLNMVDDATGKTLSRLEAGETTEGVFRLLWSWIEHYGIPLALYVDLKALYVSPKEGNFSQIENACKKLGIRIIKAYSAQAKGRVERNHAVYQDRFVKELRLKNIRSIQEANELLESYFIDELNKRFEKPARNPQSAHRACEGIDLNQMLCWEYSRQLQNDWTFSFEGCYYQVKKPVGYSLYPKARLYIRRHLNGEVSAHHQDQILAIQMLLEKPLQTKVDIQRMVNPRRRMKPAKSNPWRHFFFGKAKEVGFKGVDDPAGRVDNPDEKTEVFSQELPTLHPHQPGNTTTGF